MYVCVYACMYVCTYVCIYMCVCIRIYIEPLFFDCDSLVFENDSFFLGETMQLFFAFQFGDGFPTCFFSFSRVKFSC